MEERRFSTEESSLGSKYKSMKKVDVNDLMN